MDALQLEVRRLVGCSSHAAWVAQWIARLPPKEKAPGSSPGLGAPFFDLSNFPPNVYHAQAYAAVLSRTPFSRALIGSSVRDSHVYWCLSDVDLHLPSIRTYLSISLFPFRYLVG